jgi:hypothetical protein
MRSRARAMGQGFRLLAPVRGIIRPSIPLPFHWRPETRSQVFSSRAMDFFSFSKKSSLAKFPRGQWEESWQRDKSRCVMCNRPCVCPLYACVCVARLSFLTRISRNCWKFSNFLEGIGKTARVPWERELKKKKRHSLTKRTCSQLHSAIKYGSILPLSPRGFLFDD